VVPDNLFGDWKVFVVVDDVSINSEVNNWVVLVVTWILLWVLVLVAAGGGADWVGLNIKLKVLGEVNSTNELTGRIIGILSIMIKSIELVEIFGHIGFHSLLFKRFIETITTGLNESLFILKIICCRDSIRITIISIILFKSASISLVQEAQHC
jgi:hypothetical protein